KSPRTPSKSMPRGCAARSSPMAWRCAPSAVSATGWSWWRRPHDAPAPRAMTSNLRFRLLLLLVLPLSVLALMGAWFAYRSAEAAAGQHDQRLMRLLPALAEAVVAPSLGNQTPPLIMLPP